jgi:hypothetical protein
MDLKSLLERTAIRGEDYLEPQEFEDVVALYRTVMAKSRVPVYESPTGFHSVLDVIAKARATELGATQTGAFKSYIGPRRPRELYVGNAGGQIAYKPFPGTPAYDIISTCGLNNNFPAGFIDYGENLPRAWDALYNPHIITIDDDAADACNDFKLPFNTKDNVWNN